MFSRLGMTLIAAAVASALAGCSRSGGGNDRPNLAWSQAEMGNPVIHFEIPVTDLDRAVRFYEAVLGHTLSRQSIDGYEMAFFPRADGKPGASGALAKGDVYIPAQTGSLVYFDVPDIDAVLARAVQHGARILYPKKHIGEGGYVAEIEDSEGNRIALNAATE